MDFIPFAIISAVSYLVGGVPFALLVGKVFYRTDIRQHGSGNLGATNVFRVLGWKAGLAVFLLDAGKGALAVSAASFLSPHPPGEIMQDVTYIIGAIMAVLGHSYSPFIRFRGGKGVATASGALLIITPLAWLVMLVVFIGVVAASKMVSLGSIIIATIYPALSLLIYPDRPAIFVLALITAALVIWRHRMNIKRIMKGQESKIFDKSTLLSASAEVEPAEVKVDESEDRGQ
ncbi:MAG: glycerol-3-phosphate 1-O-acyltransferase PlsY [Actinobacteria bacterium]|nr:glycerol-3-phosphate 1-O-acyltransferase PlsY [Actinomycetota bacterium]